MFENFSRTGYVVIIVVILGVAYLSQQTYAREYGKKFYLSALAQEKVYWAKVSGWTASTAFGAHKK